MQRIHVGDPVHEGSVTRDVREKGTGIPGAQIARNAVQGRQKFVMNSKI